MSKNAEGWIRHRGGKCPVEEGVMVDVRHRDREVFSGFEAVLSAPAGSWNHANHPGDIMAYRLHKPAEQAEACSKPELQINLPGGYGEIYNAQAVEQGPLQWRDRITTIDFDIHSLTSERADLVQKLASEGLALIGRINDLLTDAAQKHEAQQPDPGKWEVGDSVECISSNYSFITVGTVYVITGFYRNMVQFLDDDGTETGYERANFKFHSRPSA